MHEVNDYALDAAAWELIYAWPLHVRDKMPADMFNNIKPLLRVAISKYVVSLPEDAVTSLRGEAREG